MQFVSGKITALQTLKDVRNSLYFLCYSITNQVIKIKVIIFSIRMMMLNFIVIFSQNILSLTVPIVY